MGLIDSLKGKAYEFIWKIAAKKGLNAGVKALMAWVASLALEQYGISISFEEAAVVAAGTALLEVARNYMKHKLGVKGL